MTQRLRERERSNAKVAEDDRDDRRSDQSPMGRFKTLARRLVNVPRRELVEQRRKSKDTGTDKKDPS
jgi:hypothetical protein